MTSVQTGDLILVEQGRYAIVVGIPKDGSPWHLIFSFTAGSRAMLYQEVSDKCVILRRADALFGFNVMDLRQRHNSSLKKQWQEEFSISESLSSDLSVIESGDELPW